MAKVKGPNSHPKNIKLKTPTLTKKQKEFLKIALNENTKIIYISGPAGSTKTFIAVYAALRQIISKDKDLVYVRTVIESAERNLGFLPGGIEDKFNPYMLPLNDKLYELIEIKESPSHIEELAKKNRIQAMPINYLRGASWTDKVIIADEAQNFTIKELTTLITRIGENCSLFICGDPMQSDINGKSGFNQIRKMFDDEESRSRGIYNFNFTEEDIKRSEILKFIIKKIGDGCNYKT